MLYAARDSLSDVDVVSPISLECHGLCPIVIDPALGVAQAIHPGSEIADVNTAQRGGELELDRAARDVCDEEVLSSAPWFETIRQTLSLLSNSRLESAPLRMPTYHPSTFVGVSLKSPCALADRQKGVREGMTVSASYLLMRRIWHQPESACSPTLGTGGTGISSAASPLMPDRSISHNWLLMYAVPSSPRSL